MSKVLVMGASGFLGSHVVKALVAGRGENLAGSRSRWSRKYLRPLTITRHIPEHCPRSDIENSNYLRTASRMSSEIVQRRSAYCL